MSQQLPNRKVLRVAAHCVLGLGLVLLLHAGPMKAHGQDWKDCKYEEASECKKCHNVPTRVLDKAGSLDISLMAEYPIWKIYDKHAQAYAVLEGPRGQRIGKNLFGDQGENWKNVLKAENGCLACHAMNNLSKENEAKGGGKGLDPKDGVSCGGCHGPSSEWKNIHSDAPKWRDVLTAEQKEAKGMRNLRDPIKRAELCTSCHIGSVAEGKVVTHSMFAAGHPPLPPIEISSFSRNLPQHWRDDSAMPFFQKYGTDPKVRKNYQLEGSDFQRSRYAVIGNVVALRKQMKLAQDRANLDAEKAAQTWPELLAGLPETDWKDAAKVRAKAEERWPELALAHSDCYACHHDLNFPGYRQGRGYGYQLYGKPAIRTVPGRILVRQWPLAGIEANIGLVNDMKRLDGLQDLLASLAKSTTVVPFGKPKGITGDSAKVVEWCDQLLPELNKPEQFTRARALQYMNKLCEIYGPAGGITPDYETARQVASVLRVMYEDVRAKDAGNDDIRFLLTKFTDDFDLEPYKLRDKRGKIMLGVVKKIIGQELKGQDDFEALAKNVNDPKALKQMLADALPNQFLTAVAASVDNESFTAGLREKAVVDQLQELSDKEEKMVLAAVARYNPDAFKQSMKQLAAALK